MLRDTSTVSVLVVGGGINGAAIFRDLSLQGIDVLLVDKSDFSSGTSSSTSHMAHGGLRYLEYGDFRLVREALEERNRLLKTAPHYVVPLPTTIPIFKRFTGLFNAVLRFFGIKIGNHNERGALLIKIGLMIYDFMARHTAIMSRHFFMSRKESLSQFPLLNPKIICTATYYDAFIITPERVCFEMICDTISNDEKSHAINYMSVCGASDENVFLQDELTNEIHVIKPTLVVNAAGPWIDEVNRVMEYNSKFVRGSKGSHIVIDHNELRDAIDDHEIFFENDDGRIVLICPFLDKILVGTSDLICDDYSSVSCTDEEIRYFIAMINKIFPTICVTDSHIVFTFSGVRPLLHSESEDTSKWTRDHSLHISTSSVNLKFPIITLAGGKWTTFRSFAAKVTDHVLESICMKRLFNTESLCIGGGKDYPIGSNEERSFLAKVQQDFGLDEVRSRVLYKRYGTKIVDIAVFLTNNGRWPDKSLEFHNDYTYAEIAYITKFESVVRLDDLILRRTMMAMMGELTTNLISELCQIVGECLGWSDNTCSQEIDRMLSILAEEHRVQLL